MNNKSFFVCICVFLILATSCQFNCPCKDKIIEANKPVPEQNITEKELDTEIKLNIEGASQLYIVESKNTDSVSQRNAKVAYIPTESKLYMLKKQNGVDGNLVEEAVSYINSKGEKILDLIPKEIVKVNSKYVLIKFIFFNIPKGFIVNKTNGKAYSFDLCNESEYFFYETNNEDIVYYHERGYTPGSLKPYGSIKKLDFTNSIKGIETEVTRPDVFCVTDCEVDRAGNIIFRQMPFITLLPHICITSDGYTFEIKNSDEIIPVYDNAWWTAPEKGNIYYVRFDSNDNGNLRLCSLDFKEHTIIDTTLGYIDNGGSYSPPSCSNVINLGNKCFFVLTFNDQNNNSYSNIYSFDYNTTSGEIPVLRPLNEVPIVETCVNNVNTVFNNKVYIATGKNLIKCINEDNSIIDISLNKIFKITNLSSDNKSIYFTAMDHNQNDVLGKIDKEHQTTILENKQIRKIKELQSIN